MDSQDPGVNSVNYFRKMLMPVDGCLRPGVVENFSSSPAKIICTYRSDSPTDDGLVMGALNSFTPCFRKISGRTPL